MTISQTLTFILAFKNKLNFDKKISFLWQIV